MNLAPECLPCLGRNAVDAALRSTDDAEVRKKILSESFHLLADADFRDPPPLAARRILDIALKHTGKTGLFDDAKKKSCLLAEKIIAELGAIPEFHPQEFESRLRLAIAGNILDFGVFSDLDTKFALEIVRSAFHKPLDKEAVERLRKRMDSAEDILYILDNCGEASFDRIFLEPYRDKVTLCVRGREVLNDVTEEDLAGCGMADWPRVTSGPSGIPGTMLSHSDDRFRVIFSQAGLIIAKGQGNFETMNEYKEPIAFLFLAKCPVVTRLLGVEQNSIQVRTVNFR